MSAAAATSPALPDAPPAANGPDVEGLAQRVAAIIVERLASMRGVDSAPYTLRDAARALGIGRNDGIHALIEAGALRTIRISGKTLIPADEVARVQREGTETTPTAPMKKGRPVSTGAPLVADMMAGFDALRRSRRCGASP